MAIRKRSRGKARTKRVVQIPAPYFEALELSYLVYPFLYQFENGLRLMLDSFLKTCYGSDWWNASLRVRRERIFEYAEGQRRKLDSMPWIGDSSTVEVLPIHLVTLGQLEEIVKAYQSECIPDLFPNIEFFIGHMELIKRVRNMYSHMFPCITRSDCMDARSEIRILARHINAKLQTPPGAPRLLPQSSSLPHS
jgi:hypothetical protein